MKKTITVEYKIWRKLVKTKLDWGCETIGDVIERLFKICTKIKLSENEK